jgi:hypothetical protein
MPADGLEIDNGTLLWSQERDLGHLVQRKGKLHHDVGHTATALDSG